MKRRRRIMSLFLTAIMIISTISLGTVITFAETSGDFEYSVISEKDKTCAITKYTGTKSNLILPSQLGNYTVTSIDSNAFEDCTSLISVTIPDSVTSFFPIYRDCSSLTNINVGNENRVFSSLDGVLFNKDKTELLAYPASKTDTEYTIPDSVTSIGCFAFSHCTSLESITIPNSVTSIFQNAFYGCDSLASITIPDSVTSIGWFAFADTAYYNMESNWENGVLYIGKYLMDAKENISGEYRIKDGTVCIADNAFSNCTSLENITIPDSVTSIGQSAFYGCSSLTSATIPDSITSMGQNAFFNTIYYDKSNWENGVLYIDKYLVDTRVTINGKYTIKDGTVCIANGAFLNCTSLESITIPDSVTSIGDDAFYGCSSLTSITIPGRIKCIGKGAFYNCSSLTNITIPNSITDIAFCTFHSCTSLTSITIPDSVTSIGDGAFYGCDSLTFYGHADSYAISYAIENGIPFNVINQDKFSDSENALNSTAILAVIAVIVAISLATVLGIVIFKRKKK